MPPRLVLLRHHVPENFGRPSHWDLLLERAGDCWTWAIDELPAGLARATGPTSVPATRLANHRKHYLEYEGSVSGKRGDVTRVLAGTYEMISTTDERVELLAAIDGARLRIVVELMETPTWTLTVPLESQP